MADKRRWEPTPFLDAFVLDRAMARLLTRAFADAPINPVDYALYSSIALFSSRAEENSSDAEDNDVTATQLANDLKVPLTTMTDWIAGPVRRGHVVRRRSDRDGRAWALSLTPAGSEALAGGRTAFGRAYEAFLQHTTVDPDELSTTLTAMAHAVARAAEDLD
ncbi:MAG: hypothetical protein L0G99_03025 [Propionibacteriales bacterium]|nr:hypothetical protein [Propionibacteriales bacterium]